MTPTVLGSQKPEDHLSIALQGLWAFSGTKMLKAFFRFCFRLQTWLHKSKNILDPFGFTYLWNIRTYCSCLYIITLHFLKFSPTVHWSWMHPKQTVSCYSMHVAKFKYFVGLLQVHNYILWNAAKSNTSTLYSEKVVCKTRRCRSVNIFDCFSMFWGEYLKIVWSCVWALLCGNRQIILFDL